MKKRSGQKCAQGTVEFFFVFMMLLILFFCLVEISLYWRARYAVETLSNELLAHAQLAQSSTDPNVCPAADAAIEALENRAMILSLNEGTFSRTPEGGVYTYRSDEQFLGSPRVVLTVDCREVAHEKLSLFLTFKYHSVFLYTAGANIVSAKNYFSPKF